MTKLLEIGFREFSLQIVRPLHHAPKQISDAFQVSAEAQTCKQFARLRLCNFGNCRGKLLINLLLDTVKLLFAITHRKIRHAGRVTQKFSRIKRGVTGDQTRAYSQVC